IEDEARPPQPRSRDAFIESPAGTPGKSSPSGRTAEINTRYQHGCQEASRSHGRKLRSNIYASSSIGRAAVSKTAGWGFDSLLACHPFERIDSREQVFTMPGVPGFVVWHET